MKFILLKKRNIIITFIIILLVLSTALIRVVSLSTTQANSVYNYTIVIDAGHGGIDGGCVGYNGTEEAEINLKYAKCMQSFFHQFGFKVVMTRQGDSGLYSPFAQNKKKDDMIARKEIIEKSKPNIVISVHMNSFTSKKSRGAQVFYSKDSEQSQTLANSIQKQFKSGLVKSKDTTKSGDYYILKCTERTSVLVECGFLSNPEEEKLLLSEEYMEKLCYLTLCGVVSYLGLY